MTRTDVEPWFDQEDYDELSIEGNDTMTVFSDRVAWADGTTEGRVKIHYWFGPITGDIALTGADAVRLGTMLREHGERATGFDSP